MSINLGMNQRVAPNFNGVVTITNKQNGREIPVKKFKIDLQQNDQLKTVINEATAETAENKPEIKKSQAGHFLHLISKMGNEREVFVDPDTKGNRQIMFNNPENKTTTFQELNTENPDNKLVREIKVQF